MPLFDAKGAPPDWRRSFLIEYTTDIVFPRILRMGYDAVRDERYKLVHAEGMRPMLFDLAADPHELVDRRPHRIVDHAVGTQREQRGDDHQHYDGRHGRLGNRRECFAVHARGEHAGDGDADQRRLRDPAGAEPLQDLGDWLEKVQAFWSDQLDAFKDHVARRQRGRR